MIMILERKEKLQIIMVRLYMVIKKKITLFVVHPILWKTTSQMLRNSSFLHNPAVA